MKEKIKLYYDLDVENVNDYYYDDGIYYQFIKWERTNEELKDIISVCKELSFKDIKHNEVVLNVNNNYISDGFILIKNNYFLDDEILINDICNYNQKLIINKPYDNKWLNMWKSKVDYLEYQVNELAHNKISIVTSFSYYVGLAENAISMLKKISTSNDSVLVLSRLRVKYPNYANDYFNPLNFIFDSKARDVAEYLKSKFFSKQDILEDVELLMANNYFNNYEYNLFFIRMLYPSYYFDELENVLLNNADEDRIIEINSMANEYEDALRKIMLRLSQITNMEMLPWLIEKE